VKRIILVLLFLAAVAAAYVNGQSRAQIVAPAMAITATKVGVINIGFVYSHYERVKTLKMEMDEDVAPYKKKKTILDKTIVEWRDMLSSPDPKITSQVREEAREKLIEAQRHLEDLERQVKNEVLKKAEDQVVVLHKEINDTIKTFAAAHGYHMILAYGEPEVPLAPLAQFQRYTRVVDQGGITHAYSHQDIDVSREVVKTLNSKFRARVKDGDE
jgi:Skp family chaperone for outer membrane proteins